MLHIKSFTFNPFSENTYVLYNDNGDAYIIDPGNLEESENQELKNFISSHNLNVKNIVLTHAHIDHIFGLQWAYDTYKVPVVLHETEKEMLDLNPMVAKQFGFSLKPFEGDLQYVKENDILTLGEDQLKIYEVPGHSPGHVAYHSENQNFIISGDVLFDGSIGRTDLYKGNYETLLNSIKHKLLVLDNKTEVFSGHGKPTNIGLEKQNNPFLK